MLWRVPELRTGATTRNAHYWRYEVKMLVLAGVVITLPAIVVILYFWGSIVMIPAVASLLVAALPFFGFAYVLRGAGDEVDELDGH